MSASSPPRLMLYNGLGHGLGHRERCLKIATEFVAELPGAEVLLVTAAASGLDDRLPPAVEVLALPPGGIGLGTGSFVPADPESDLAAVHTARAQMIRDAVVRFRPDLVLVEHLATGMCGELLPAFELMETLRPRPKLVLGVRDIIDEPAANVQPAWERTGAFDEIATRYDRVLVYGCEQLVATADRYGFAAPSAGKLAYCGYIGPPRQPAPGPRRACPTVVVTGGGGVDAYPLMSRCIAALRALGAKARVILVAGPAMSDADRDALVQLASGTAIEVRAQEERMLELLATTDVVISMAGYNTLTEAIAAGCRVLVMPRLWATPRQAVEARENGRTDAPTESEQQLRAELFAQLGLVEVIEPAAGPEAIAAAVECALEAGAPEACELALDGATRVTQQLCELLGATRHGRAP
jgi:predicted glycosyltransferase